MFVGLPATIGKHRKWPF